MTPSGSAATLRIGDALPAFKVITLGQAGVGKTSLINRYVKEEFSATTESTTGFACLQKEVTVEGKTAVKLLLYDTAGQERFNSLVRLYFHRATAAVIVYDVTDQKSLEQIAFWKDQASLFADSNLVVAIVGNKTDLAHARQIHSYPEHQTTVSDQVLYFETSAKSGSGVKELFQEIGAFCIIP
ncbi:rab gtpase [Aphelenchoides avenae]|nr:rab gtpase [Aphelenchus avenae]